MVGFERGGRQRRERYVEQRGVGIFRVGLESGEGGEGSCGKSAFPCGKEAEEEAVLELLGGRVGERVREEQGDGLAFGRCPCYCG